MVFLGDSITEGKLWDERVPTLPTVNRGIGGDTVRGVLDRLDSAIVEPQAVSVLIGTNDPAGTGPSRRVADIAAAADELLSRIRSAARYRVGGDRVQRRMIGWWVVASAPMAGRARAVSHDAWAHA